MNEFLYKMAKYVIYCRKSTEENTDKQTQSIPDQLRACLDYAKRNDLELKEKDSFYDGFETPTEKELEFSKIEISDRQLYKENDHLFIIREMKSAKTPWCRPKRNKLIKLVEKWVIDWILSYSPDRQARNMVEWWAIIDLVDRDDIDVSLKYTNFHFDPNASGKMMLGFWFVFSKHYSDKLSEDVWRGKIKTVTERGKADWNTKHWYKINKEWFHEPHPIYFSLIQEAFHMKLYENKSNKQIKDWLTKKWYVREYKTNRKPTPITEEAVSKLWTDSFYYWIFVEWEGQVDLREYPYYKQMITEEEFAMLVEIKQKDKGKLASYELKDEYEKYIMPFDRNFIKTEEGFSMTFNVPNKTTRHEPNLAKLRKINPNATLADVIKIHQIRYSDKSKTSKIRTSNGKKLDITADIIDNEIIKMLKKVKISDEHFNEYLVFAQDRFKKANEKRHKRLRELRLQQDQVKKRKENYITKNASTSLIWEEEEKIYNQRKKEFDIVLRGVKEEIDALDIVERDNIFEFEAFLWLLKDASRLYTKASFVQKRRIASLVCLNIIIDKEKRVHLTANPLFESLIIDNGGW